MKYNMDLISFLKKKNHENWCDSPLLPLAKIQFIFFIFNLETKLNFFHYYQRLRSQEVKYAFINSTCLILINP